MTEPRSARQRVRDTLARLEHDVDAWVSTADAERGTPYLVPLSFWWDGETLLVATSAASPTARNLREGGEVRLALGLTRDVVLIEGAATVIAAADLTPEVGDAFAAKTGFDPRTQRTTYNYFRIRPTRVQSWREANELRGRDLMTDGVWIPT